MLYHVDISPSLKTLGLLKWRDEYGCQQSFRLESEVNAMWKEFGIHLGMSPNHLRGIDAVHRGDPTVCWNRVMEHWLAGQSGRDYPPTWEGLYILLNDMELPKLAREMEKAVAGYCPF